MFKTSAWLMGGALLLSSFCLGPVAHALESYGATPDAVFARALVFGQASAVETFIAEAHPDLDATLSWSGGKMLRPISLVLSQLHSEARYRLSRSQGLSTPADESDLVYLLLRFGASAVYQEPYLQNQTPIHLLFDLPVPLQLRLLPLLLRYQGENNLILQDDQEQTPAVAAKAKDSPLRETLEKYKLTGMSDYQIRSAPFALAKGVKIYEQLAKEESLSEAVKHKQWSSVKKWLEAGVSTDTYHLYPNGVPLLHTLAQQKSAEGVALWSKYEANFRILNLQRQNVLHVLVQQHPQGFKPEERLAMLLQAGAEIDAQDREGNTPLHLAQKANQHIWVDVLIQQGADPNLQNQAGLRALPQDLSQ